MSELNLDFEMLPLPFFAHFGNRRSMPPRVIDLPREQQACFPTAQAVSPKSRHLRTIAQITGGQSKPFQPTPPTDSENSKRNQPSGISLRCGTVLDEGLRPMGCSAGVTIHGRTADEAHHGNHQAL
jgi:hypothetical protein